MIKKADIILFFAILVIGIFISIWCYFIGESGTSVEVTVNGELYGSYDINKDHIIDVKQDSHINKIIIKDGKVSMSFSDCHNQDCVLHDPISKSNETITCLPNKVMITIQSDEEGGYDVISN